MNRLWQVAVVGAGLLWLLTILASAAMNASAGYALGSTPIQKWTFAALAVAADGWKSLGPIFVTAFRREGKITLCLMAGLVWMACFTFSVSSAIGVAALTRATASGGREAIHAAYTATLAELQELRAKRGVRSGIRAIGEIEAAIAAALASPVPGRGTVGTLSQDCTQDTPRTRSACAAVAALRTELAGAKEAESLTSRISELETEATRLASLGGSTQGDPQERLLSRLLWGLVAVGDVDLGLVLVLVIMVELVSAFGPIIVIEALNHRPAGETWRSPRTSTGIGPTLDLRRVGDVFEYLAACVRPAPHGRVEAAALVANYQAWCTQEGYAPLTAAAFQDELERICRDELGGRVYRVGTRFVGLELAISATARIAAR